MLRQDCRVADEQKLALKKAAGVSEGKTRMSSAKGRERVYWMGTEIGMLGGYGFQGQVTAGDGSDKKGKMGAGYNNLKRKKKKQQCKVEHEEEGSSSNRPESVCERHSENSGRPGLTRQRRWRTLKNKCTCT